MGRGRLGRRVLLARHEMAFRQRQICRHPRNCAGALGERRCPRVVARTRAFLRLLEAVLLPVRAHASFPAESRG